MLKIVIPGLPERWDEANEVFLPPSGKDTVLKLEHSLISISKWESKYHVPFLHSDKTDEQILDYIKCMTLNSEVDDEVYARLTAQNVRDINNYIADPMTATTVNDWGLNKKNKEIVTSELIYYWMIAYGIPAEFEKWHINRLIMLIRVCSAKNDTSQKKMSRQEIAARNKALNEARKAKYNTKG